MKRIGLILILFGLTSLLPTVFSPATKTAQAAAQGTLPPGTQIELVMTSDQVGDRDRDYIGAGQSYKYTFADGKWFITVLDLNRDGKPDFITFYYLGEGQFKSDFWGVDVGTNKIGKNLEVGVYENARRAAFAPDGNPGLDVGGNGRGCNMLGGRFTIFDSKFDLRDPQKPVCLSFGVSFTQFCEFSPLALRGTLRYNTSVLPPDEENPKVSVTSPRAGQVINSKTDTKIDVAWTSLDNQGVASHSLTYNGIRKDTPFSTSVVSGLPGTVQSFSISVPKDDAVTNATITVAAKDNAGNTGTGVSGSFTVAADGESPKVSNVIFSKKKVDRKKDPTIEIAWRSEDNLGVIGHTLFFSPTLTFSTPTLITTGLPGTTRVFKWTVPNEVPKTKTGAIKVVALDGAGNTGEAVGGGNLTIK
ncbi:MAG: hypothetical protein K1Y36_19080 [Blastocatellia bacterium]|nr:hypothetical protein [Blastocatellia bacterium]